MIELDPRLLAQEQAAKSAGRRQWWLALLCCCGLFVLLTRNLWLGVGVARGDTLNYFLPYYMLLADFARHGQLLTWDPWSSGGLPMFIEPQTGALSPLTMLFALISGVSTKGYVLYALAMWLVGPIGVMLLGRHFRAPAWGCLVAALGYAACGVYLGQPHHLSHQVSFSFIPWILWRWDAALHQRSMRAAAEAGALLGLSGLGGYPGLTVLTFGYCILWAGARVIWSESAELRWGRRMATAGLLGVIASGVAAVVLAPSYGGMLYEGKGVTTRSEQLDRDYAMSVQPVDPLALSSIVSPGVQMMANEYLQGFSPDERVLPMRVSLYCGLVPLVLALAAVACRPRSGWRWAVLGIGVVFLAISVGREMPLRQWLYDLAPPLRLIRFAGIFRDYWFASVIVLALVGARDVQAMLRRSARWIAVWTLLAMVVSAGAFVWLSGKVDNVGGLAGVVQIALMPALAVAVGMAWWKKVPRAAVAALLLVGVADVVLAFAVYEDRTFCFHDQNARDWWARFDERWNSSFDVNPDRAAVVPAWNEHLVRKQAVLASFTPMRNAFLPRSGGDAQKLAAHVRTLAFACGPRRFWFCDRPAVVMPDRGTFEAFAAAGRRPMVVHGRKAMLGQREEKTAEQSVSQAAEMRPIEVQVVRYRPDELVLKLQSPGDGWLLVTDRWARSWGAWVNGERQEVLGGNFLYRAVLVPKGPVTVEFRYELRWMRWLLGASWGVLGAVAVWSGGAYLARRRTAARVTE